MKSLLFKMILSLLLSLVASFSFGQKPDDIKFEKTSQKFMRADEGHIVTLTYNFYYTGDTDLQITPPEVDCSCTEVILPEGKINPNSSNQIKIKFNTTDKIGWQDRAVTLHFTRDAMDSRSIKKVITFKGAVKASKETKAAYKAAKKKQ